jgi:hypothetical protein
MTADGVAAIAGFSFSWNDTDLTPTAPCIDVCRSGQSPGGTEVVMLGTNGHTNFQQLLVQIPVGSTASTGGGLTILKFAIVLSGQAGQQWVSSEIQKAIAGGQLQSFADEDVIGPIRFSVQTGAGAGINGESNVIQFAMTATACNCAPWAPDS